LTRTFSNKKQKKQSLTYLLKMTQEVTSTLYTDDITACDNVTALILSPKLKLGQASVM